MSQRSSSPAPGANLLSAVFDAMEDAVLLADGQGRVLFANQAAAKRLGRESDPVGADLSLLSDGGDGARLRAQWLGRVSRLGRPAYFEIEERGRIWDVAMFPAPGPKSGAVAVVERDVTQARHDRADLEAARRDHEQMTDRLQTLEERLASGPLRSGVVAASAVMAEALERIAQAGAVDSPVLLVGEPGTGKTRLAQAVHQASDRAAAALVRVDCSEPDETLLLSELFGHARGAVPGVVSARPGRLAAASEGTLLLTGVDRLGSRAQQRLAHYLESGEYEPLGSSVPESSAARVVATTEAELAERVRRGSFRQDLFYQLRPMSVVVSPLNNRSEDVVPLAEHFLGQFGPTFGKHFRSISREARQALLTYPWPGNVRELKHAMEHAAIRCAGEEILPIHLPPEVVSGPRSSELGRGAGREAVLRALETCRWNKTRAARMLGISRGTLYNRLKTLSIQELDG